MIERNKSEAVNNKCYKCQCTINDKKLCIGKVMKCSLNKWQSGKPEVKQMSKLDEARNYFDNIIVGHKDSIGYFYRYIDVLEYEEMINKSITELQEEIENYKRKDKEAYGLLSKIWDFVDKNYSNEIKIGESRIDFVIQKLKQNNI
jgi:hypothetical protein